MSLETLASRIDQLCSTAGAATDRADVVASLDAVRRRLHSPLRIGVVGRVKAGKSTLLNALIGERLAPTDAGECTRFVSSYHFAPQYDVRLRRSDGAASPLPFRKGDDALEIEIPSSAEPSDRLEIGWPARRLSEATLIDTPGLGSLDPALKERGRPLFSDDGAPASVDAVLYLMRHAHREDIDFLEGFREAGLPFNSPVNTVAVLSRIDEIGGGRLDALESASRIAARYQDDERISALAAGVIPVAGLLAETGVTLQEDEFLSLKQLMQLRGELDPLLLSVDRFRDAERNPLAAESRENLLSRFGLFGIRFIVQALRQDGLPTAQSLAEFLDEHSGIRPLREMVRDRFSARSQQLVARSAIAELRAIARQARPTDVALAADVESALEEIASSSHELAELELAHRVATGDIRFDDRERAEMERLSGGGPPARSLGLPADASIDALRHAALSAIARWRERSALPLTDRQTRWAADVMTRTYEGLYSRL